MSSSSCVALEPVPDFLDVLVAGFPCTSASILNKHSHSDANRSCVTRGDLATGGVFKGIAEYVRAHGRSLRCLLFENVLGLAREGPDNESNLDAVVTMLSDLGWVCQSWHLDPRDFGAATSRPRLWIVCMNIKDIKSRGFTEASWGHVLRDCMDTIAGSQIAPMANYLMPAGHPDIVRAHSVAAYGLFRGSGDMARAEHEKRTWTLVGPISDLARIGVALK